MLRLNSLLERIRNYFFRQVPGDLASEYYHEILKENIVRVQALTITVLLVQIPRLFFDISNSGQNSSDYGNFSELVLYINSSIVCLLIIFAAILFFRRRKDNPPPEYRWFSVVFILLILAMSISETIDDSFSGKVFPAFIIGVSVLAVGLYFTFINSLMLFSFSYLALFVIMGNISYENTIFSDYMFQLFAYTAFSFVVSRMLFNYRLKIFLNQKHSEFEMHEKDIAEQKLQKLNSTLEHIVTERTNTLLEVNDKLNHEINIRKVLQRNILHEKNLLEKIIDRNPFAIGIFDKNGNHLRCNSVMVDCLGFTPGDDYNFFTDDNLSVILEGKKDDILMGSSEFFSCLTYKLRNSDLRYYALTIFSTREENNAVNQIVLIFEDITERIKAEEALKLSESKYRSIVENAVEGIFQSTLQGRHISVNQALAEMYGYSSPEELINDIDDIGRKLYVRQDRRRELVDNLLRYGKVMKFESQVYQKNHKIIWISENVRVIYNANGEPSYLEGSVINITDRKIAEIALRDSEENYRMIVNNVSDVIFKLNNKGVIQYITPHISKVLGYDTSHFYDKLFVDFIHPEDINLFLNCFSKVLSGSTLPFEIRMIDSSQSVKHIRVSAKLTFSDDFMPIGITGILSDITDKREGEKYLYQLEASFLQSKDAISITDMNGVFEFVNNNFAHFLGYSATELIGKHISEIHNESQLSGEVQNFNSHVIKKGQNIGVLGFLPRNKSITEMLMSTTLIKDRKGVPIALFNIAFEIDDVKSSLQVNPQEISLHSSFFEDSDSGFLIIDVNGNILEINKKLLDILGSPSKEQTKKINILTFPNMIKAGLSAKFQECIATGESVYTEANYLSVWGKELVLFVYLKPSFDESGHISRVFAIVHSASEASVSGIIDNIHADAVKSFVDNSTEMILMSDQIGNIVDFNYGAERYFKLKRSDLPKYKFDDIFPEIKYSDIVSCERVKKYNNTNLAINDGSPETINLVAIKISDNKKTFKGFFLCISLLNSSQTQHAKIYDVFKQETILKPAFINTISHDLKIPVNSILGFSLLFNDIASADKKKEMALGSIRGNCEYLLNAIDDISDLLKISSNIVDLRIQQSSANEIIKNVIATWSQKLGEKASNVKIVSKFADNDLSIKTDTYILERVLGKIIENSIQHTYYGVIEIGCNFREDEFIEFYVCDTGAGMSSANYKELHEFLVNSKKIDLFESKHRKRGLFICKGYIETIGGKIRLESEEGKGTNVYCKIPVYI